MRMREDNQEKRSLRGKMDGRREDANERSEGAESGEKNRDERTTLQPTQFYLTS